MKFVQEALCENESCGCPLDLETRKNRRLQEVSATFGLIPRFPAELGQRKGESRSIPAGNLLSEHWVTVPAASVFSGLPRDRGKPEATGGGEAVPVRWTRWFRPTPDPFGGPYRARSFIGKHRIRRAGQDLPTTFGCSGPHRPACLRFAPVSPIAGSGVRGDQGARPR